MMKAAQQWAAFLFYISSTAANYPITYVQTDALTGMSENLKGGKEAG